MDEICFVDNCPQLTESGVITVIETYFSGYYPYSTINSRKKSCSGYCH